MVQREANAKIKFWYASSLASKSQRGLVLQCLWDDDVLVMCDAQERAECLRSPGEGLASASKFTPRLAETPRLPSAFFPLLNVNIGLTNINVSAFRPNGNIS